MIQLYTGNGKGKTTAALGQCFRAAGHGLRSKIFFFMKGNIEYGELTAAAKMNGLITVQQCGRSSFVDKKNPDPVDLQMARDALNEAEMAINQGEYDIIVLDELCVALDFKLIEFTDVKRIIKNKPEELELIITGRYATAQLMQLADLITEMKEVKHYYNDGIEARKAFEY